MVVHYLLVDDPRPAFLASHSRLCLEIVSFSLLARSLRVLADVSKPLDTSDCSCPSRITLCRRFKSSTCRVRAPSLIAPVLPLIRPIVPFHHAQIIGREWSNSRRSAGFRLPLPSCFADLSRFFSRPSRRFGLFSDYDATVDLLSPSKIARPLPRELSTDLTASRSLQNRRGSGAPHPLVRHHASQVGGIMDVQCTRTIALSVAGLRDAYFSQAVQKIT